MMLTRVFLLLAAVAATHAAIFIPGTQGDPHIMKWDGDYFDYHGECDLMLVDAPEFGHGEGLMVQMRTKQRDDYSFTANAAIRIGQDILEVTEYGKYFFNGVEGHVSDGPLPKLSNHDYGLHYTNLGEKLEDYHYQYAIHTGHGVRVVTTSLGEYISVMVEHANQTALLKQWFGASEGLMGSFDGSLVARDGVTVMDDHNEFGQEWQVLETEPNLFQQKDRAPQHPAKCIPPPATTERRLRGITRETAEKACAHVSNNKEACIFDVQATNDLKIAKHYRY